MLIAQTVRHMHDDAAIHPGYVADYYSGTLTSGAIEGRELLEKGVSAGAAFGRSVVATTGKAIVGGLGYLSSLVPVDFMKRSVSESAAFGYSVAVTAGKVASDGRDYLNCINPVSLAIRHGPAPVSVPLKYIKDEVDGFTNYMLHPSKSLTEVVTYFAKKPIRFARLMQALGIPVDPATMAVLKMEGDIDKVAKLAPGIMAGTSNVNKMLTTNVERLRGKIVLSLVKAAVDGGEDLMEDTMKYLPQLFMLSGERVVGKSLVKAGVL